MRPVVHRAGAPGRRAGGVRGDIRHPIFGRTVTRPPRARRASPIIDRPTLGSYLIAVRGSKSTFAAITAVAGRDALGGAIGPRSLVCVAKPGGSVLRRALVWRQFRSVLFLWLAGLADGLVPKERHYAQSATSPNNLVPPLPRVQQARSTRWNSASTVVHVTVPAIADRMLPRSTWASPCSTPER